MTDKERGNAIDWLNDLASTPAEEWQIYYSWSETKENATNALALLKEQEPKQVEAEVINEIDRLYRCPSCHISMILRKQPYCHSCGQELKWE